jgi:hypothetical protein
MDQICKTYKGNKKAEKEKEEKKKKEKNMKRPWGKQSGPAPDRARGPGSLSEPVSLLLPFTH